MADNSLQSGADTIRDKDRAGVKTQIVGLDLGIGTGTESLMAGSLPVTGTFWQATQPVSLATNTPTLAAGTNQIGTVGEMRAGNLAVTVTAAAATVTTLTLPAAGAGLFHYIVALDMVLYSTAARTGVAAPIVVTSTNLPGTMAWTFTTAGAIGTVDRYDVPLTTPLRSAVANTATTIVGPSVTGGLWRFNAVYFTAV